LAVVRLHAQRAEDLTAPVTVAIRAVLTPAFVHAAVTNFFFIASLSCFILLPLYIHEVGGTEVEVGLIMGIYHVAGIVCQPLVGVWVDRLGRRPFMLVGAWLVALSALAFLASSSSLVFAFLRVIQGIGFSAFFVANYTLVVDLAPAERRGWALGIYGIFGLSATALTPLASEWLIRNLGYPPFFALAALLALVGLALVWRTSEPRATIPAPRPGLVAMQEGLGDLFRLPMALAFIFGIGVGTISTFLPTFAELLGVRHLAFFYTGYAGAAILVRAGGGQLIDSLGRRAVIVPSFFLLSAGGGILALLAILVDARTTLPVLPFLFLAGFVAGSAHGFLYPALSALLIDLAPDARRGSAVGLFSSVILAGHALGSMLFGYVAHGLGYGVLWTALTLLVALGFGASFRLSP